MTIRMLLPAVLLAGGLTFPSVAEEPETSSILIRNISGYVVIDDEHIALRSGSSRAYLVTLDNRCWGLRFGSAIGTSFRENRRISNPRFEYITTGEDRCYIDTIELVDSVEIARELVAERAEAENEGAPES